MPLQKNHRQEKSMKPIQKDSKKTISDWLYQITVFFLALTGVAQLPIFKRYYIADIPGLGWLAKFYTTHYFHYLAGTIFLLLVFYKLSEYWLINRHKEKLTVRTTIRVLLIAGIILTGVLLVIKNFSGSQFSANSIITLDISHLVLALILGLVAISRTITRKRK